MIGVLVVGFIVIIAITYYVHGFTTIQKRIAQKRQLKQVMDKYLKSQLVPRSLNIMIVKDNGDIIQNTLNKKTIGVSRPDEIQPLVDKGVSGGYDVIDHINLQGILEHHVAYCKRVGEQTVVLCDKIV